MLKIISKKEYQRLKDKERKYDELTGQVITFWTGCRSTYKALLSLSKEELVSRLFKLNNICTQLERKLKVKE